MGAPIFGYGSEECWTCTFFLLLVPSSRSWCCPNDFNLVSSLSQSFIDFRVLGLSSNNVPSYLSWIIHIHRILFVAGITVAYTAPARHGCLQVVENDFCSSRRGTAVWSPHPLFISFFSSFVRSVFLFCFWNAVHFHLRTCYLIFLLFSFFCI